MALGGGKIFAFDSHGFCLWLPHGTGASPSVASAAGLSQRAETSPPSPSVAIFRSSSTLGGRFLFRQPAEGHMSTVAMHLDFHADRRSCHAASAARKTTILAARAGPGGSPSGSCTGGSRSGLSAAGVASVISTAGGDVCFRAGRFCMEESLRIWRYWGHGHLPCRRWRNGC